MVYENPTDIQQYDYQGKMYQLRSGQVSLTVTPNHRMYVKKRSCKKYVIELAENLLDKQVNYKKNVKHWEPAEIMTHITLPKYKSSQCEQQ